MESPGMCALIAFANRFPETCCLQVCWGPDVCAYLSILCSSDWIEQFEFHIKLKQAILICEGLSHVSAGVRKRESELESCSLLVCSAQDSAEKEQ
jgi:hypothetical protein